MKCLIIGTLVIMMLIGLTAAEGCAIMCTMIYAPICATDGVVIRTFSSACTMTAYNCQNTKTTFKQLRTGACELPDADAPDVVF